MFARWKLTVRSLTKRRAAISLLRRPRASRRRTSNSRAVRVSRNPAASLPAEARDQATGDLRLHQHFATRHHSHRLGEFVRGDILEDVSLGACAQCLVQVLFAIQRGEQQDVCIGVQLFDLAQRFQALTLRKLGVQDHHLRSQFRRLAHGLHTIDGLTHHLQIGIALEQATQPGARHSLVVDDKDANVVRAARANDNEAELRGFVAADRAQARVPKRANDGRREWIHAPGFLARRLK